MESYKFQLSFSLPGFVGDAEQFIDNKTLAEQGITARTNQNRVVFTCERRGRNAYRTIRDTVTLLQDNLPEASLKFVAPDLIPEQTACSLLKMNPAKFKALRNAPHFHPRTVTQGKKLFWHLKELLEWMRDHRGDQINPHIFATAEAAHQINSTPAGAISRAWGSGFDLPDKYSANSYDNKSFIPPLYR